jgi:hypothetical protein
LPYKIIKKEGNQMVKSIEFKPVLVNTELGEAYTWIELRNQIEQNLLTKKLFDQWNKDTVLNLIEPYIDKNEITQCELIEQLENIFKEIRDNDTIILIENKCSQIIILAILEFLYQENYKKKIN